MKTNSSEIVRRYWAIMEAVHQRVKGFLWRLGRPKFALNILVAVCVCYLFVVQGNRYSRGSDLETIDPIVKNNDHQQHSLTENEIDSTNKKPVAVYGKQKKILYWTGYYDRKDMVFGFGSDPFVKKAGCKVANCFATDDRSQLNESDAIIFHAGDYRADDLPAYRQPHQRYIFYLFETLPHGRNLPFFSSQTDNYFNWTMTHRRDSDVYIAEPYGVIRRKESAPVHNQLPPPLAPGERPLRPAKLLLDKTKDGRLASKDKMVAWFCSNTATHGRREDYIRELQKHVQVSYIN